MLWLEEIQSCVDKANTNTLEGLKGKRTVSTFSIFIACFQLAIYTIADVCQEFSPPGWEIKASCSRSLVCIKAKNIDPQLG